MKSRFKKKGMTNKQFKEIRKENGRDIPSKLYQKLRRNKKCSWCNKPFKNLWDKEIHHLKPISAGGKHTKENLVIVHKGKCHEEADKRSKELYPD